jgi:hypothetical protein
MRRILADGGEKGLQLGQGFNPVIGFNGGLPRADRAGEKFEPHRGCAGGAPDFFLPAPHQLKNLLLVAEFGIDLPTRDEHGILLFWVMDGGQTFMVGVGLTIAAGGARAEWFDRRGRASCCPQRIGNGSPSMTSAARGSAKGD